MKFLIASCLLILPLASCVTVQTGEKKLNQPETYQKLKEGESTKREVYALLKQPYRVNYSGEDSKWVYKTGASTTNFGAAVVPFYGLTHEDKAIGLKVATHFNNQDVLTSITKQPILDRSNSSERLGKMFRDDDATRKPAVQSEMKKYGWKFSSYRDFDFKTVMESGT